MSNTQTAFERTKKKTFCTGTVILLYAKLSKLVKEIQIRPVQLWGEVWTKTTHPIAYLCKAYLLGWEFVHKYNPSLVGQSKLSEVSYLSRNVNRICQLCRAQLPEDASMLIFALPFLEALQFKLFSAIWSLVVNSLLHWTKTNHLWTIYKPIKNNRF